MNIPIRITLFVFSMCFSNLGNAQNDSLNQFSSPLNIPLFLAGNFGEIRGGHFHAGIDIKTQQVEGHVVLAAADGYISRVKVALGGYGNALYITHKNGYTTAYGHLQKFNNQINKWVLEKQYQDQKFTVERFFNSTQIPVKRGDTIAISGNSGGSGGPHLHFEIRKNGIPQNPLKYGFDIQDNIAPIIKNIGIYPMNDSSFINGQNTPLVVPVSKVGDNYILKSPKKLTGKGVLAFGIEAIDKLNGSNNRCGVYTVSLETDSHLIYQHQMDQIRFENTRFIQTHVDFYEAKKYKRRIQKSYLTSYNKLKIYRNVKNKGQVYFSKYGHNLQYKIADVNGNVSTLAFNVTYDSAQYKSPEKLDSTNLFTYQEDHTYTDSALTVFIPKYSLYEDLHFQTTSSDTLNGGVSLIHEVQNLYTPLQKKMTVSILTQKDKELGPKYFAVSLNAKNKVISPEGGTYKNGWVTFRTRSMGPYTILVDTIAPQVKPVNFSLKNPNLNGLDQFILKAQDPISGVKTFNAFIDNEWVLLEYDYKTNRVWINTDTLKITEGSHELRVKIGDSVNNFKTFTFNFIW